MAAVAPSSALALLAAVFTYATAREPFRSPKLAGAVLATVAGTVLVEAF